MAHPSEQCQSSILYTDNRLQLRGANRLRTIHTCTEPACTCALRRITICYLTLIKTSPQYFAPVVRGAPEARGPRHMPLLPYRLTRHCLSRRVTTPSCRFSSPVRDELHTTIARRAKSLPRPRLARGILDASLLTGLSHQGCVLTATARRPRKIQNAMVRAVGLLQRRGRSVASPLDAVRTPRSPCHGAHFEHAQSAHRGSAL